MYAIIFIEHDSENVIDTNIRKEDAKECKKIIDSLESIIDKDKKKGFFASMKLKDEKSKKIEREKYERFTVYGRCTKVI